MFRQGLQLGLSIVLARLLTPREFGTIALLSLFLGVAGAFVDGGLSGALIQRQDVTHTDESTVFWFNGATGLLAAMAVGLAGPWLARFYGSPVLNDIAPYLGLNVLLGACGAIHGTLLGKRLDFKTQMMIGSIATVAGGAVAISMALRGKGVWALVALALVTTGTTTGLLWVTSSWRPSFSFSVQSAKKLFGFGGYLLASSLLESLFSRAHTLVIGKLYGPSDLGQFSRAENTSQVPAGVLSGVLSRVAFPVLSAAGGDREKVSRGLRTAIQGIMFINVPLMLGLAAVARPLVLTLFGDAWAPSILPLRVLCLAGMLFPLHVLNLSALMAQGRSDTFFRLEVAKKVVGTVLLVAGSYLGLMGIAWSRVIFSALAFGINAHYSRIYLSYGAVSQIRDCAPAVYLAVPIMALVWWLDGIVACPRGVQVGMLVVLGGGGYLLAAWCLRFTAIYEGVRLLRDRLESHGKA